MRPRGRNAADPQNGNSTAESAGHRQAREDLDRKLDDALEATFPASDPFDLSTRGRSSGEPA
jgi:hypothetical protein